MEFTCSRCGLTYCGILIGTTPICEDCFNELYNELMEDKGITFTEAIQKYDKITNDKGETYYYKDNDGDIYKTYTKGLSCSINANIDFLLSTGWEEYKDKELKLPTFIEDGSKYCFISGLNEVCKGVQRCDYIDREVLKACNYFTDRRFTQYVADKQLIQRIELTLIELNKDRFPKEELTKLINKYLRDNYMEVLDRIIQYEL